MYHLNLVEWSVYMSAQVLSRQIQAEKYRRKWKELKCWTLSDIGIIVVVALAHAHSYLIDGLGHETVTTRMQFQYKHMCVVHDHTLTIDHFSLLDSCIRR